MNETGEIKKLQDRRNPGVLECSRQICNTRAESIKADDNSKESLNAARKRKLIACHSPVVPKGTNFISSNCIELHSFISVLLNLKV